MSSLTRVLALAAVHALATAGIARADSPNFLYFEALGKAGAYGIGYERSLTPRIAIGGAGSFAILRGEQLTTIAPYLHTTLVARGHNALFADLGAMVVHSKIPSPVADWHGMATTGGGAFGGIGWQRTIRRVDLRTTASAAVGAGGIAPMLGIALGWRP